MNKETPQFQASRLGAKLTENQLESMYQGAGSILVQVIGKSGRGKSASIRNLPVEQTFLFNVVGKPLPFLGGHKYIEGKNMLSSASATEIRAKLVRLSKDETIKYIVIDDAQYIMATEFMAKAMEKGYEKFTIMARNFWDLLVLCSELRKDMVVFLLTHEDDSGNERKMKTLGKLLDEKLTPEGLATIVLFADVTGETPADRIYYFQTQSDGNCNAKSPMDMLPALIENDLALVAARIREYYQGIPLEKSEINFGEISVGKSRRTRTTG